MELTCPHCSQMQSLQNTVDTYFVVCEGCGEEFRIPRERRKAKRTLRDDSSRVNIRVGFRNRGEELRVGWTVQSADKRNQYLEKDWVRVDVANHPQKLHWYVALFKCLQHINDYKSARIWVKDQAVLDHLAGDASLAADDPREALKARLVAMCSEKFYGSEFCPASDYGNDIRAMIS